MTSRLMSSPEQRKEGTDVQLKTKKSQLQRSKPKSSMLSPNLAILKEEARKRVRAFYTNSPVLEWFQEYIVPLLPKEEEEEEEEDDDKNKEEDRLVEDSQQQLQPEDNQKKETSSKTPKTSETKKKRSPGFVYDERKTTSMRTVDAYMKNMFPKQNIRRVVRCRDGTMIAVDGYEVFTQRLGRYHVPNFNPFRRKDKEYLTMPDGSVIRSAVCQLNYFMCFIEFHMIEPLFKQLRQYTPQRPDRRRTTKVNHTIQESTSDTHTKPRRRRQAAASSSSSSSQHSRTDASNIHVYHLPLIVGFDLDPSDSCYFLNRSSRGAIQTMFEHIPTDIGIQSRDVTGIAFVYGATDPTTLEL